MDKIKVVFITGNENKCKEVNAILGNDLFTVIHIKLDLPEIQSMDVVEVVNVKIKSAYELALLHIDEIKKKFLDKGHIISFLCEVIIICEDTALNIANMNNFPGTLIKYYYESIGNKGISERDGGSHATTICVIGVIKYGLIQPPIIGIRHGIIATKLMNGVNGFGWDPIFIPDLSDTEFNNDISLYDKSYAELSKNIKDKISHRSIAFIKLKNQCISTHNII